MEPDCREHGKNAVLVCLCTMREIKRKFGVYIYVIEGRKMY